MIFHEVHFQHIYSLDYEVFSIYKIPFLLMLMTIYSDNLCHECAKDSHNFCVL